MIYFLVAAAIIAAIAAATDLRTGEMPNWVTVGPLLAAPFVHFTVGLVHHLTLAQAFSGGLLASLVGAVLCAIVPAILYRQEAIGGGDLKLLAAIGALLPPRIVHGLEFLGLEAEMYSFFAAGLIAPAFLAYEGKLFRTLKNTALLAMNPLLPKKKRRQIEPALLTWFRFGPAIFIGTAITAYLHWRG